jgi:Zn-dependent protease
MFMSDPLQIVSFILALVVSISIHEFSHAWSANELGDPTARNLGRLTLNPIKHFDPLGALMIVFMSISGWGIGWGKPVPVNPFNLRTNPRVGMGLTSAAGPFSNLVLASLFAIPLRMGLNVPWLVWDFLWVMVLVNVSLALFNLIPLPPLDGFNVLQGILASFRTRWAYEWGDRLDKLAPFGPVLLLGLLSLGWVTGFSPLGWLLGQPLNAIASSSSSGRQGPGPHQGRDTASRKLVTCHRKRSGYIKGCPAMTSNMPARCAWRWSGRDIPNPICWRQRSCTT